MFCFFNSMIHVVLLSIQTNKPTLLLMKQNNKIEEEVFNTH